MSDQNTCMACLCPCELHKEHNHPTEQALKQQEHSMTCSKCGLKVNASDKTEAHGCQTC